MDRDAQSRIDDLEYRLAKYHDWLVESIAERDRLAIDAAWGVHMVFHRTIAVVALFYAFDRFVGWQSWLAAIGLGVAVFVVEMAVHMWSNGERMREVDRFAKLPEWERRFG